MLLSSLFGTNPSAGCALAGIHRLRRNLAAVLLGLPLLLGLVAPNEAHAQTSCNVSNAKTQTTNAYNHHRNNGNEPTATAAYRALITFELEFGGSRPAWSGTQISGPAPTTPISEAELRTFLTGRGDTWGGWNPVYTALNCLEAPLQMRNATLHIAEFGNHKDNGGVRVLVEIGDGAKLAGHARTINYTVDDNVSRDDKDYTIDGCTSLTCSVKLPANRHTAVITIFVNDDGIDEDDETIVITLKDGSGYTLNDDKKTTTITIRDDDTRGLTFHRRWADVKEGGSEDDLTLKLSSQPTAMVTVNIASDNPDVTVSPTSLTFNPSGDTKRWDRPQMITVSAAHDDDAVNDTATLTYTTSGGDYGGANALSIERPVSVDDDDTADPTTPQLPRISLTGGPAVTEGTAASFTVNADRAPTSSLTINLEVSEFSNGDFVAANQEGVRTVTLNAGATSTTFTVSTVDDNADEDDGAVQVFVNDGTGYSADQGTAVTVRDNDDPIPGAFFYLTSSNTAESGGPHRVRVDLSGPAPPGGLTLRYNISGTAAAGSGNDFTIQNSGMLSITAGDSSATIPVAINDDSAAENAETVILTLIGGTGYTVDSPSIHTLTIEDNDSTSAQSSVSFAFASSSAAEDAGTRNVTVNISPAPSGGLTLSYSVTGTATAGSSNDFTIQNSGTLSVAAGATSATIPVAINDDSTQENAETVILTLNSDSGYTVGSPSVHTLTITDNDGAGQATLSLSGPASTNEGDSGTSDKYFTVSLSGAPSRFVSWQLCFTGTATIDASGGGTIPANADYQAISGQTPIDLSGRSPVCTSRSFSPPFNSLTNTDLGVRIKGDTDSESNETVVVTLSIDDGPTDVVLGTSTVTYTIQNDDNAPIRNDDNDPPPTQSTASFATGTSSAAESAGTRNVTVNLSSAAPSGGLTLGYSVGGTATPGRGNDYTIQSFGSLTIAAGAISAIIPVVINDDSATESAETVTLTLTGGTGYTLGSPSAHTLTITDNDVPDPEGGGTGQSVVDNTDGGSPDPDTTAGPSQNPNPAPDTTPLVPILPSITISAKSISVEEGTPAGFTVSASQAPTSALTIHLRVNETTADGQDYIDTTDEGPRTITLDAGTTSMSYTVPTVDDTTEEPEGRLIVTVEPEEGYTVSATAGSAAVAMLDNDDPVYTIAFTTAAGRVEEGNVHEVTVRVDPVPFEGTVETEEGESEEALVVRYTLSGTADPERDYAIRNPGMVTVPAGEATAVIRVTALSDGEAEAPETVIFSLLGGQDQVPGEHARHVLTIVDGDDPDPGLPVAEDIKPRAGEASLVRFGRSVTDGVLGRVLGRVESLDGSLVPGMTASLAGASVNLMSGTAEDGKEKRDMTETLKGAAADDEGTVRNVGERELILGTGFSLSGHLGDGWMLGLWGGGSLGSYEGRDGTSGGDGMDVNGDVLSLHLGYDISGATQGDGKSGEKWLAGVMMSRHDGDGGWGHGNASGEAENSLTTLVPYGAVDVSEDLRLWSSVGWGQGRQSLDDGHESSRKDTEWRMLAGGFRRDLDWFAEESDGFIPLIPGLALSLNGDIRSTRVSGFASSGRATRMRLGLEGSVVRELEDGRIARPWLEVGVRRDGGDAETGTGVEVGGGVRLQDAAGLEVLLEGRTVAMHGESDYRDHGISVSVDWDSAPETRRGLTARLGVDLGGGLASPLDANTFSGLSSNGSTETEQMWRGEVAYGWRAHPGGLLGSPYLSLTGDGKLERIRAGYRAGSGLRFGGGPELDLYTLVDREDDVDGSGGLGAGLEFRWHW